MSGKRVEPNVPQLKFEILERFLHVVCLSVPTSMNREHSPLLN